MLYMLYAVCNMLYAIYAVCYICCMLYAVCYICCMLYMLYAICCMLYMLYANTVSSSLSSSLEVVVKLRRALASAFKRSADGYPLDIAYGPDRGWWLRRRFLNRAGESTLIYIFTPFITYLHTLYTPRYTCIYTTYTPCIPLTHL